MRGNNKGQLRYAEEAYWSQRYEKEAAPYEWFYGFQALKGVIRKFVPKRKPVLQVGCGNSNLAENMGQRGYQLVNADISSVLIRQMQEKHAGLPGVSWVVSDCRKMPEFHDCQFGSVIDKGTLDALLCSDDAEINIDSMLTEILRVLTPGGIFLLVTLGDPARRLHMICKSTYTWDISVVLLPKVDSSQLQCDEHRHIPYNDVRGSLDFLGPFQVLPSGVIVGLPQPFDPAQYFYAYLCKRKPLQLGVQNQLPQGWTQAAQEMAAKLQEQMGTPKHLFGRGQRRNVVLLSELKQRVQKDKAAPASGSSMAAESDSSLSELYSHPNASSNSPTAEAASVPDKSVAASARRRSMTTVDLHHSLDTGTICSADLQGSDHR